MQNLVKIFKQLNDSVVNFVVELHISLAEVKPYLRMMP